MRSRRGRGNLGISGYRGRRRLQGDGRCAVCIGTTGEQRLSSDPLPSPDQTAAPRNDAEYEAVYAEIMATERGRSFLAEYAKRSRHADAHQLVGAAARLEASLRDGRALQMPAALIRGLADSATIIGQIKSALAAGESLPPDIQFAAERISDIARALRQRDVETALCDWLEVVAREIGDAIVSQHAASGRALSAAHLLQTLSQLTSNMIALAGVTGLAADEEAAASSPSDARSLNDLAGESTNEAAARRSDVDRLDDTAQEAASSAVAAPSPNNAELSPQQDVVRSFEPVPQTLPEIKADAAAAESANDKHKPPSLPIPSPLEGEKKSKSTSALLPNNVAAAATRPALYDSLAALRALSEEELIALFS